MNKLSLILAGLLISGSLVTRSQTIGFFHKEPGSFNGYTLFSGAVSDSVFLIDNCGKLVHTWQSHETSVRQPVLLLPNGSILKAGSSNNPLFQPGGGKLQLLDWNSNVMWTYTISDSSQHAHHDFKLMPNGNILVTAWERKSPAEQLAAGRDPANIGSSFWPDKIMELKPVGPDSAIVVWQWKVWDHLIQSFDPNKANYGVIEDHPELIDINALPATNGSWNHINSVDYNPDLDQILLSARNFSEIWIIDHSVATSEAAGHIGGHSGKGGDLLYRWGNSFNYHRGTDVDQRLFAQHDAQWIKPGYPDAGMISIFNNGSGRPGSDYSTVFLIKPPLMPNGNYQLSSNNPYGPSSPHWVYPTVPDTTFFSNTMGGASMQPNGTFLITEANSGEFFEVDSTGAEVWRYVCPVKASDMIMTQGDLATGNEVFKINRYAASYPGFSSHTLTSGQPIELNPLPYDCSPNPTAVRQLPGTDEELVIYPNPASGSASLRVTAAVNEKCLIRIIDLTGRVLQETTHQAAAGYNNYQIDLKGFLKGVYMVQLRSSGRNTQELLIVN